MEQRTTISRIIKDAIRARGTSQRKLADALGYSAQSGVSERLRGDIRMWGAVKILNHLGYDVVVRDRKGMLPDRIVKPIDELDNLDDLDDLDELEDLDEIG